MKVRPVLRHCARNTRKVRAISQIRRNIAQTVEATQDEAHVPYQQLRQQFKCAAVPMVGFGFMDNTIMIHAGDWIDNSIGYTFGFATLVAAGFGQVLSDSSGIVFGNSLEAFLGKKINLTPPDVTPLQRGSFR